MQEPGAFCRTVMHEYERQWSRAGGHALRHPLRLKIERLKSWCEDSQSAEGFEAKLAAAQDSDDPGTVLLATELQTLWEAVQAGQPLPFSRTSTD